MAGTSGFGLGLSQGTDMSCNCGCGSCCNLVVGTSWCGSCVAPGTITVTVRQNNAMGAIVCQGTANGSGNYTCCIPSSGTYYFSASTTATGYTNTPFSLTITFTTAGNPCSPASVTTSLCPTTLMLTDVASGNPAMTMVMSGVLTDCFGNGLATGTTCSTYICQQNITFMANCGCSGLTCPVYYYAICGIGGLTLNVIVPDYTFNTIDFCPGCTTIGVASNGNQQGQVLLTGTGPPGPSCYPMSLTGSITWGFIGGGGGPPLGPGGILYGGCAAPVTTSYVLTQ